MICICIFFFRIRNPALKVKELIQIWGAQQTGLFFNKTKSNYVYLFNLTKKKQILQTSEKDISYLVTFWCLNIVLDSAESMRKT